MSKFVEYKNRLVVRADLEFLSAIRNFVCTESANAGITNEEAINKFMLSTEESCSNLIRHSLHPTDSITLTSFYDCSTFEIDISDKGQPFNPLKYDTVNIKQHVNNFTRGGLGIYITRNLTDEIEYLSEKDRNTLKLIWKL